VIAILITGGTFDKEYNELAGTLAFKETHVPEMLRLGRSRVDVAVRRLMMIDSLDMTDADRRAIADACLACAESHIVVTHGTDTMVETAQVLAAAMSNGPPEGGHCQKTVVLTGAMVPYAFGSSDGLFNLGSALSFAQSLPAGVYIAMNGRAFAWNDVRKNRASGIFESL
jgi:L-asparaginase